MNKIKSVRVFNSEINYHNGENIGPGFGIVIDPHPTSDDDIFRVAQAIRNVLEGLKLEDES